MSTILPFVRPAISWSLLLTLIMCTTGQDIAANCNPGNCSVSWEHKTRVIYYPGHPDCPVTVSYRQRICGLIIEIRVDGLTYPAGDFPACLDLIEEDRNDDGTTNWAMIRYRLHTAAELLTIDEFAELYQSLPDSLKARFDCDQGGIKIYRALWGSCIEYSICWQGFESPTPWELTVSECGLLCCIQEMSLCWNTTTNQVEYSEQFFPHGDDCGPPHIDFQGYCLTVGCFPFCPSPLKQSASSSTVPAADAAQFAVSVAPNPLEDQAEFSFRLQESADISLRLCDQLGRSVLQRNLGILSAGQQSICLDAAHLPGGVYTYMLQAGKRIATGLIAVPR